MSEFISKLEGYADLEVSIIRATKINKVLKAILKLTEIPKEGEFHFKDRSKSLLEKWNKILESAEQPAPSATPAPADESSAKDLTNGVAKEPKAEEQHEPSNKDEAKGAEPLSAVDADTTMADAPAKEEAADEPKATEESVEV
jgi:hypothetical protein